MIKTVGFNGLNPPYHLQIKKVPYGIKAHDLYLGWACVIGPGPHCSYSLGDSGKKKGFHVRNEIHYPRSIL